MTFIPVILSMLGAIVSVFYFGFVRGEVSERNRTRRMKDSEPFPEPEADEADGAEEDVDICLRVGMAVICRLSESSHTHGTLLGFAMSAAPDGPMLAVVDVNAAYPMPIDVDLVEPRPGRPMTAGYRENADPSKPWN